MPKAFLTTVIGSLPKPAWLYDSTALTDRARELHGAGADWMVGADRLREAQDDAVRIAVYDQEQAGIDIISDGEQRRKSYLSYVVSRLGGFDYEALGEKWVRKGRRLASVGRCAGPVAWLGPVLEDDLRFLMSEANRPVKITMPGPMSVVDSTLDEHYGDERRFAFAVAKALNQEVKALDKLSPAVIQFDEPAYTRYPEKVAEWGIEALNRCIEGVQAATAVHVCYSYPMPGVPRPITPTYPAILQELERSGVNQISLEFEAAALDPELLEYCPSKTVLFGCVSNGREEVESPEHIADRLLAAAKHHAPEKVQAAPDCGLVTLSRSSARGKLKALVKGAAMARERLYG